VFLLLIIKYSETDAVKHNREQRFKAGTVSKDVFLFYCVQEHVESKPFKVPTDYISVKLLHGVISIHIMRAQDLYLCAVYYLDPDHTDRIYFLVLHHVDQDVAHKRLS